MVEKRGSRRVADERSAAETAAASPPRGLNSLSFKLTLPVTVGLAVIMTLLAFSSYSRSRVQLEGLVDSLGATLARTLAAPEPETWSARRDTILETAEQITELAGKYGDYLEVMYGIQVEPPARRSRHVTSDAVREQQDEVLAELRRTRERNADALRALVEFRAAGKVVPSAVTDAFVLRADRNELVARANPAAKTFVSSHPARPLEVRSEGRLVPTEVLVCSGRLDGAGPVRSFEAPIRNAQGEVTHRALVFVSEEWLERALAPILWRNLLVALVLVVAGSAAFHLLTRLVTGPLLALTHEFQDVADGALEQRTSVHRHDEIGLLARSMDAALRRIHHSLGDQQLEITGSLQRRMAPEEVPYIGGYPVEVVRKTAPDVGSTYHDFVNLPARQHGFVLAQASRSGIDAALHVLTTGTLLRAAIQSTGDPSAALRSVDATLRGQAGAAMTVAVAVAVLNRRSGRVTVASAGGLPVYLYRASKRSAQLVTLRGTALGIESGESFAASLQEQTVQLEPGDRLVLANAGVARLPEHRDQEAQLDPLAVEVVARAAGNAQNLRRELLHLLARARLDHDVVAISVGCGESVVTPLVPEGSPGKRTPQASRLPRGARLPVRRSGRPVSARH